MHELERSNVFIVVVAVVVDDGGAGNFVVVTLQREGCRGQENHGRDSKSPRSLSVTH